MNFENKLAVVTGGASGIGAACARFIAKRGGKIIIADRNIAAAQVIANEIGGHAIELDIADEAAVRQVEKDIAGSYPPVAILVNCAGVLQRTLPPDQLTMKEWEFVNHVGHDAFWHFNPGQNRMLHS